MNKYVSNATELTIVDVLAERAAFEEFSAISEAGLWLAVQPRLPRGDAARAYAADPRYQEQAESMTQAQRVASGQRMFFDDALAAMTKRGQVREGDTGLCIGAEPLWQRSGEGNPLAVYIPGSRPVEDAEAEQRIEDRKILNRITDRKSFQVTPDSDSYQLLRWSMDRYGVLPEFPIVVDASDTDNVLSGRTRLAVARELDTLDPSRRLEEALLANPQRMRVPDAAAALRAIVAADVARRHLSRQDVEAIQNELGSSDDAHEELDRAKQILKSNEDAMQRNQNEARARIHEELLADASRPNVVISGLVGVSHPWVGRERKKLEQDSGIHAWSFPGGRGSRAGDHSPQCWCQQPEQDAREEPDASDVLEEQAAVVSGVQAVAPAVQTAVSKSVPAQPRKTDGDTVGAQAEIRKRVRAGEPIRREEISSRYQVSEMFVRETAAAEVALLQQEQEVAERARAEAEAAELERMRHQHLLTEWADRENRTVQEYREAPAVILDDLIRRLADLRKAF